MASGPVHNDAGRPAALATVLRGLLLAGLAASSAISKVEAQQTPAPEAPNPTPSWQTQREAMAYALAIPAPRGQISDRNGVALAQTRVSYNLSVVFPTPLDFSDAQVMDFVGQKVSQAHSLTKRSVGFTGDQAVQHYRNRGLIPYDIATDLPDDEVNAIRPHLPAGLILRPIYVRFYPQGMVAGHLVGYTGRTSRTSTRVLQNNEPLWPESEGREGLEQTFDDQLRGTPGRMDLTFDKEGRKTGERIAVQPQPGYNVVTTLDTDIQKLAEKILQKRAKRGAIALVDPNNGEVLALASWPGINPNDFVPTISEERFAQIANDPNIPLLPRAYRSAYPAGSTFKVFVGVAAFESHKIDPDDEFNCPSAMTIGNLIFHNWRKHDGGDLNFRQALTVSCDTWFYQLGLKLGAKPMVAWAQRLGLGRRTGILLNGEAEGRIPTDPYMEATYHRHFAPGDLANFSIGQGDILVTPLQMAQAMATIANGGTLYQTRIVRQIQTLNDQVMYNYAPRAKDLLNLGTVTREELRQAMVSVVSSGTGNSAEVEGVKVAGKTGTAQWGPKTKEKTAAWFAGFAPADAPRYAFAALYEGSVGEQIHGGTAAAPMIGELMRAIFKKDAKQDEESDQSDSDKSSDESD